MPVLPYVRTCIRIHMYTYLGMYVRTYVCTFVCMYVRMYVCTCILHIGGDAIEKAMHSYPGLNEEGVCGTWPMMCCTTWSCTVRTYIL